MRRILPLSLLLLLLMGMEAHAKVALQLGGGFTSYTLEDLNQEIDSWGMNMDNILGGNTLDIGAEYFLSDQFALGAYFRVFGSSISKYVDPTASFSYDASAYGFEIVPKYFPSNENLYIGCGIGGVISTGDTFVSITNYTHYGGDIEASCLSLSPMVGMILVFTESAAVDLSFGYRDAKTDEVTIGGVEQIDFGMDWSGIFLRGMLRITF